jgi:hypothetical protein
VSFVRSWRVYGWHHVCIGVSMKEMTCSQEVRCAIQERSHEILNQALLEMWRRPSLPYMRRMAEWELRAWLLGILRRVGGSDPSLGFLHFSRPFPWHEAVETVRILMHRTTLVVGGNPETDLRRFCNHYLIRLGEHYEPFLFKPCQRGSREIPQVGEIAQSDKS